MVKTLDNFDRLLEELSMIEYDEGKKFDPRTVKFTVFTGPGSFEEGIEDSHPFPKLREAYNGKADVRYADFYGTNLMIRVSFDDSMRKYLFSGVYCLSDRPSGYVEVTFPARVLV